MASWARRPGAFRPRTNVRFSAPVGSTYSNPFCSPSAYLPISRPFRVCAAPKGGRRPVVAKPPFYVRVRTHYCCRSILFKNHYISRQRKLETINTIFFFLSFFPFHLLSSPFYSLSLLVVAQIRGHITGSSPPLPTTVRALHFYREKISALSSLVDSRRIVV